MKPYSIRYSISEKQMLLETVMDLTNSEPRG